VSTSEVFDARAVPRADQPLQVRLAVLAELQSTCKCADDLVGWLMITPLLEAEVVLGADPGEHRHFLPAEARDLPVAVVDEPDVLRCEEGAPCAEVLTNGGRAVHQVLPTVG
jgi:hypothetical protein